MNKNYFNWKEPITSFDKGSIYQQLLPPGRYHGLDKMSLSTNPYSGNGVNIHLYSDSSNVNGKFINELLDIEPDNNSVVVNNQGSVIRLSKNFTELLELPIKGNEGSTVRYDAVVMNSQYVLTTGDNLPTFSIVLGDSSGNLPTVSGNANTVIAYIEIPVSLNLQIGDLILHPANIPNLGGYENAQISKNLKRHKSLGQPDNIFRNLSAYENTSGIDGIAINSGVLTIPSNLRSNTVTVVISGDTILKNIVFEGLSNGLVEGIQLTIICKGFGTLLIGKTNSEDGISSPSSYDNGDISTFGTGDSGFITYPTTKVLVTSPGIIRLTSARDRSWGSSILWNIEGWGINQSELGNRTALVEAAPDMDKQKSIIWNINKITSWISSGIKKYFKENYDSGEIDETSIPAGQAWIGKFGFLKVLVDRISIGNNVTIDSNGDISTNGGLTAVGDVLAEDIRATDSMQAGGNITSTGGKFVGYNAPKLLIVVDTLGQKLKDIGSMSCTVTRVTTGTYEIEIPSGYIEDNPVITATINTNVPNSVIAYAIRLSSLKLRVVTIDNFISDTLVDTKFSLTAYW